MVTGRMDARTAVQSQKAITAHFTSKQLLPFRFAEQRDNSYIMHYSDVGAVYFARRT